MPGVRLEALSDIEKQQLASGGPIATHRLDPQALEALANGTDKALARIGELTKARDAELARVDKNLRNDVRQERERAIERDYAQKVDLQALIVATNAQAAVMNQPHYEPRAPLARAKFDADPVKHSQVYTAAVKRAELASDEALLWQAREAASQNDAAGMAVILDVLGTREHGPDDHEARRRRVEIGKLADQIQTQSHKVKPLLAKLRDAPLKGKIASGRGTGTDKIAAGLRSAGF
jgi:hypothetical protein